jgi:hypothetical protein
MSEQHSGGVVSSEELEKLAKFFDVWQYAIQPDSEEAMESGTGLQVFAG